LLHFFEAVEKSVRYIIRAMYLMRIRDFDEQSIDVAFCAIGWLCKFISIIAPCHKRVLTTTSPPAGRRGGLVGFWLGAFDVWKKIAECVIICFLLLKKFGGFGKIWYICILC